MIGRIDEMKGMHLPLAALDRDRNLRLTLDIYGGVQSESAYVTDLRSRIAKEPRVRLLPPVRPEDVVRVLSAYDVMLVPSQVIETGPLVVLEAHAAGIPVIGSALGGIAERVRDGVDGRLVEAGSVRAWEEALREVCDNREMVDAWRSEIESPRTMGAVADDMIPIYHSLAADRVMARGVS
jgi:glycosyltransferase involved in cell wall biosynthesis